LSVVKILDEALQSITNTRLCCLLVTFLGATPASLV